MAATELVQELYEAHQRRDWSAAVEFLQIDATLDMPDRVLGHGRR